MMDLFYQPDCTPTVDVAIISINKSFKFTDCVQVIAIGTNGNTYSRIMPQGQTMYRQGAEYTCEPLHEWNIDDNLDFED